MKPVCQEIGGAETARWVVGVHTAVVRNHLGIKERLRRLRWRGLWLVAQHSMRLWLAARASTSKTLRDTPGRR
jgi:hypothetical protein